MQRASLLVSSPWCSRAGNCGAPKYRGVSSCLWPLGFLYVSMYAYAHSPPTVAPAVRRKRGGKKRRPTCEILQTSRGTTADRRHDGSHPKRSKRHERQRPIHFVVSLDLKIDGKIQQFRRKEQVHCRLHGLMAQLRKRRRQILDVKWRIRDIGSGGGGGIHLERKQCLLN